MSDQELRDLALPLLRCEDSKFIDRTGHWNWADDATDDYLEALKPSVILELLDRIKRQDAQIARYRDGLVGVACIGTPHEHVGAAETCMVCRMMNCAANALLGESI